MVNPTHSWAGDGRNDPSRETICHRALRAVLDHPIRRSAPSYAPVPHRSCLRPPSKTTRRLGQEDPRLATLSFDSVAPSGYGYLDALV